ncbi:MAG TPA: sulfatase [Prosthecobacter sp.]|nr:sulfatase [Prosthecobacter sp.]
MKILLWFLLGIRLLAAAEASPPNIVFILVDDLRPDALGCNGHPFVKTPNIDHLAAEGANFRNAFVTTPLCFPSRASFLSGRYVHRHGIRYAQDRAQLSRQITTFPFLLHRAGYETGFFGKWHLERESEPAPGIDRWVTFRDQGEYVDPELFVDGKTERAKGYLTDILTAHAAEFIKRPRTKPFMVCLSHKAVHAPFIPAERHQELFANTPIVRAPSASDTLAGKPILSRPGIKLNPNDPDVHSSDEMIRNQLRCLIAVDDSVKEIIGILESTGELHRTLIIFTSDHGYFWGEHDLGGKHGPYDEALRIPLLMRYPKLIKPGTVINSFALNVDLAPTLLDLAGVAVPEVMQGRSLLPLLRGDNSRARTSFLAEFFLGNGTNRFPSWQAVRNERWKYIRYPDWPGTDELYDLRIDPGEIKNLITDPATSAIRDELTAELERLLKDPW